MPRYHPAARELLDEHAHVSVSLDALAREYENLRGVAGDSAAVRTINTRMATLNRRLTELEAALATFELP